jgi:hypothetical protein
LRRLPRYGDTVAIDEKRTLRRHPECVAFGPNRTRD